MSSRRVGAPLVLAAATGLGVPACASESSGERSVTWCDAAAIVAEKCAGCHAEEPQNGAPFSLVDHDDFLATVETRDGTPYPRYERAQAMVAGGQMPPETSPFGDLSCEQRATLLRWLESNPSGAEPSCADATPMLLECADEGGDD